MENPFARDLELLNRTNYGRLSFDEQCAYYAALRLNVPPVAVATTAGVSQSVVSLLGSAGENRGGQIRYPKVASEDAALGHEAFVHKYLTAPIRDQLSVAIANLNRVKRNPDINEHGFNPRACRYLGRNEWPETSTGMHAIFRIGLHPTRPGYFWRDLKPYQGDPEVPADQVATHPGCFMRGDPSRGPEPGPGAKGLQTTDSCYPHFKRHHGSPRQTRAVQSAAGEPWRMAHRDDPPRIDVAER